jgi:hypothetical protein
MHYKKVHIYGKRRKLSQMQIKVLNKNIKHKLMLSTSEIIFLLLITSNNTASLAKSVILGMVLSIFLFKNKHISTLCDRSIKTIYLIAGLGIGLLAGCEFYSTYFPSNIVATFFSLSKTKNMIVLICVAIVGAVISTPIIAFALSYLVETGIECIRKYKINDTPLDKPHVLSFKQSFLVLFGIYLVGISAILRANFNYMDDMARVAEGYKDWGFSRILSNMFAPFIHGDNYLTDVSPLPQIIAVAIMALSGVVFMVVLYERTHFTVIEILALVPLCLNPYFLECISYKYDSPYMALSVFGAIMPLLYRKRSAVAYIVVSAIGAIIVCTTYQASSGIYPMLVISLMLRLWNNREENNGQIVQFCLRSVIGYSMGILVFRIFLMVSDNGYLSTSVSGIKSFIPNFVNNLKHYYKLVYTDFKWWWLVIIVLLIMEFIWIMAYTSKINFWFGMALSVLTLLAMGVLCFGLYPALTTPLFAPRAMYGFGILLTLLMATIAEQGNLIFIKIPVVLFSWILFVFTFTYGNALYVQKEYTEFRINQIIEDLNDLSIFCTREDKSIQISGSIGYSPIIDSMTQNYQILNRLIPIYLSESSQLGLYRFYNYYDLKNVTWISDSDSIDLTTYDLPIIEEHMYHTIRGKDNYILIIVAS